MKTLKKLIVPTVCVVALTAGCLIAGNGKGGGGNCGSGSGGFLLGAPGVITGSMVETQAPFYTTKSLGRYYKYVFRGVETKGATTGAPGNSSDANGGILHVWAGVNGADSAKIEFRDELDYNTSPVKQDIIAPITYKEQNISVNWKGNGNAHAPNGYVTILGEGVVDPKQPKGALNIKGYAVEGTTFKVGWTVQRDY